MAPPRIRVVLGKVGLDGHDRGAKVIAKGLRDAGMEVVYAGLRRTPEELAEIVLQEDAHVLGLSMLSGGVVPLTTAVVDQLHQRNLEDVVVFVGGIVSPRATEQLNELGVRGVFGPGTSMQTVIAAVQEQVEATRAASA